MLRNGIKRNIEIYLNVLHNNNVRTLYNNNVHYGSGNGLCNFYLYYHLSLVGGIPRLLG